jgi:hypothetical protein
LASTRIEKDVLPESKRSLEFHVNIHLLQEAMGHQILDATMKYLALLRPNHMVRWTPPPARMPGKAEAPRGGIWS